MGNIKGFTLIEVMITVVIVAILAAIGYPSYIDYVTKSGRSEGVAAVLRVANLQEQYYMDNRVYATDMKKLGLGATAFKTEHGYYEVTSSGTSSFTITATVVSTSRQARDTKCGSISLTSTGVKTPKECWK